MWPFSRKKPSADRIDGYAPAQTPIADPWTSPSATAQMRQRAEREGRLDRLDGWKNELTGIGDFSRDKTLGGRAGGLDFEVNFLSNVAAEARWRGSDLGARIVETIPDEMTREGWDVTVQPSEEDEGPAKKDAFPSKDPSAPAAPGAPQPPRPTTAGLVTPPDDEGAEIAEAVDGEFERLDALGATYISLCYERAYGGAAIFVGADDGFPLDQPLDEERISKITHLTPLSGGWDGEVVAWSYYQDPTKPNYGMPETYMVRNIGVPLARIPTPGEKNPPPVMPISGTGTIWWVHESRLIIFPGLSVSHRVRVQMRGWGDGVFTRVDEALQQYGQTWGGIANLMTDFSQAMIKIKGLMQAMAANKGVVSTRALQLNMSRSLARVLLLDAEEDFSRDTVSLAGVAEVLEQFALRLAAACGLPVSLLMGQVQGGLGDAAAGDIRYFYDRVASWQRRGLLPQLRRLVKLIFLAANGPTDGQEPERWSVTCRPLYQLDALQEATRRKTIAETDQIYAAMSAVTSEEVGGTRFGGSEYNDGPIVIDFEGRGEMHASYQEAQTAATSAPGEVAPSDSKIVITPSMQGGIVKVNEARAKMGLPAWEGEDGNLSINEFMAKHSGAAAQAANAEKGVVGDPQSVEEQAAAKAEAAKVAFGHKTGAPGAPGAPGQKQPFGKGSPPGAEGEGAPAKEPTTEIPPPAKDEA